MALSTLQLVPNLYQRTAAHGTGGPTEWCRGLLRSLGACGCSTMFFLDLKELYSAIILVAVSVRTLPTDQASLEKS